MRRESSLSGTSCTTSTGVEMWPVCLWLSHPSGVFYAVGFTPKWCVFLCCLFVLSHPMWVCFHCVCPCGWKSVVLCLDHPLCCMLHVWFHWCWCESVHFQHGKLPPSSWSLLERSDENVDSVHKNGDCMSTGCPILLCTRPSLLVITIIVKTLSLYKTVSLPRQGGVDNTTIQ